MAKFDDILRRMNNPNFKKWFEGSKVVDSKGRPITVFHGTIGNEGFEEFKSMSDMDTAIHFGTSGAANERIKMKIDSPNFVGGKDNARVIPVNLNIKNPVYMSDPELFEPSMIAKALEKDGRPEYQKLASLLQKKEREADWIGLSNKFGGVELSGKLQKARGDLRRKIVSDAMDEAGFDGFVYKNNYESKGSISYAVMKPTQIKSIFNKGTYDIKDPRFGYAMGGILDLPELRGMGFPFLQEKQERDMRAFLKLQQGESFMGSEGFKRNSVYSRIASVNFPDMFRTRVSGRPFNMEEAFNQDSTWEQIQRYYSMFPNAPRTQSTIRSALGWLGGRIGTHVVSNFRPDVARDLYNLTGSKKVYDYSMGWGGRLTGFLASKADEYVGVDVNSNNFEAYQKLIRTYNLANKKATPILSPAQDFRPDSLKNHFDFAFSSPPYFNQELYPDPLGLQSHSMFGSFDSWSQGFWGPTIENSANMLRPGGIFAANIADIYRRGKRFPLEQNTIDLAHDVGLDYMGDLPYNIPRVGKRNRQGGEPILFFRKPGDLDTVDPRLLAALKMRHYAFGGTYIPSDQGILEFLNRLTGRSMGNIKDFMGNDLIGSKLGLPSSFQRPGGRQHYPEDRVIFEPSVNYAGRYTEELDPSNNRRGVVRYNAAQLGHNPLDMLNTMLHEEGHRADALYAFFNNGTYAANGLSSIRRLNSEEGAKGIFERMTKGLGLDREQALKNTDYLNSNYSEMYAGEFAHLLMFGQASNPEISRLLAKNIQKLPEDYRKYLYNLTTKGLGSVESLLKQPWNSDLRSKLNKGSVTVRNYSSRMLQNILGISGMAFGGKVQLDRNKTFMVGERGPELVTIENGQLRITPNHQLSNVQLTGVPGFFSGGTISNGYMGNKIQLDRNKTFPVGEKGPELITIGKDGLKVTPTNQLNNVELTGLRGFVLGGTMSLGTQNSAEKTKLNNLSYSDAEIGKLDQYMITDIIRDNIYRSLLGNVDFNDRKSLQAKLNVVQMGLGSNLVIQGQPVNTTPTTPPSSAPLQPQASSTPPSQPSGTTPPPASPPPPPPTNPPPPTGNIGGNAPSGGGNNKPFKKFVIPTSSKKGVLDPQLVEFLKKEGYTTAQVNALTGVQAENLANYRMALHNVVDTTQNNIGVYPMRGSNLNLNLPSMPQNQLEPMSAEEMARFSRTANPDLTSLMGGGTPESEALGGSGSSRGRFAPSEPEVVQAAFQRHPAAYQALYDRNPNFVIPGKARIVNEDKGNGYTQLTSTFKDEGGEVKKATVLIDQHGNAVDTLGKRYKNFGQQLVQNYGEIVKWSLATALLYGPMQKLSAVYQQMILNQSELAKVTVSLGMEQTVTNKIFSEAASIAKETGTDIEGVISGYNDAVRATGDATSVTERFSKAQKLLRDSIILSKLAGIEQEPATDALIAAYKQVGGGAEGAGGKIVTTTDLLDKWVTVSRNANVDVNTLATSFAITAESARGAGLSIDELNGLIAVMAEKTVMSAKETGNAVRALISNYSTDAAAKELQKFGIAITDAEGNVRGFKEVYSDVKQQVSSGIMTTGNFNEVARVLGGGSRQGTRSAIVASGMDRMMGIADLSANSPSGAAEKAMGTLLDTVSAKSEQLNTSFAQLAMSLGTSGGFLKTMGALTDATSLAVQGLTFLSDKLGGAFTFLAAIGVSGLVARPGQLGNLSAPVIASGRAIGSAFTQGDIYQGVRTRLGYRQPTPFIRSYGDAEMGEENVIGYKSNNVGFAKAIEDTLAGTGSSKFGQGVSNILKGQAPAVGLYIGAGIMAAMKLASGDTGGALATAGGAIAGGLIGAMIPGGAPIGVMIGTSIAEILTTAAQQAADRIKQELATSSGPTATLPTTNPDVKAPNAPTGKEFTPEILAATLGKNFQNTGKSETEQYQAAIATLQMSQGIVDQFNNFLSQPTKPGETSNWDKYVASFNGAPAPDLRDINVAAKYIATQPVVQTGVGIGVAPFKVGNFQTQTANADVWDSLRGSITGIFSPGNRQTMTTQEFEDLSKKAALKKADYTQYATGLSGFGVTNKDVIDQLNKAQVAQAKLDYQQHQISQSQLMTKESAITKGPGAVAAIAYPLVEGGKMTTEQAAKAGAVISLQGTDEQKTSLDNLVSSYRQVREKLEKTFIRNPLTGIEELTTVDPISGLNIVESKAEIQKSADTLLTNLSDGVSETLKNISAAIQLPNITDLTSNGMTLSDLKSKILPGAPAFVKKQAETLRQSDPVLGPRYAEAYLAQQDVGQLLVKAIDGTTLVQGMTADAFAEYITELKRTTSLVKGLDIQQTQMKQIELSNPDSLFNQTYNRILKDATSKGFVAKPEDVIMQTEDNKLYVLQQHDGRIVSAALNEINEKLQKQLNGTFNLPGDATMYVPFAAAQMSRAGNTSIAGKDSVATQENTGAVKNLTQAFRDADAKSMLSYQDYMRSKKDFMEAYPTDSTRGTGALHEPYGNNLYNPPSTINPNAKANEPTISTATSGLRSWQNAFPTMGPDELNTKVLSNGYSYGGYSANGPISPSQSDNNRAVGHSPSNLIIPMPSVPFAEQAQRLIDGIQQFVDGILNGLTGFGGRTGTSVPTGSGATTGVTSPLRNGMQSGVENVSWKTAGTTQVPNLETKLNLNIENRMQVVLNGRVLWEALKPYQEADLVHYGNSSASSVTRNTGVI